MTRPQSLAERSKALRARRKALGLAVVSVWVPKDRADEIRAAIRAMVGDDDKANS